jgi:hypothetical protein
MNMPANKHKSLINLRLLCLETVLAALAVVLSVAAFFLADANSIILVIITTIAVINTTSTVRSFIVSGDIQNPPNVQNSATPDGGCQPRMRK